jgi:tetratricopeptide (TPR) repeat protein
MLLTKNDMALLSVLLTLTILHAHDRGSMAESIIRSAYVVSSDLFGESNPISLCLQWLTAAAGSKLTSCPIKSVTLGDIYMHMEKTFGTAHQHTIVALYCLGFQLIREKSFVEAEHHFKRLYEICVTTLGERSLQTVSSLNGLGKSQRRQGKLNQAIETLQKSLDKHPLGPNHPFRLDSMKELAKVYKEIGRKDLMEDIYWYVLKGRIKMLGRLHSFTEEAKIDLERLLRELGKWDAEGVTEKKVQNLFEQGALTWDDEGFSNF